MSKEVIYNKSKTYLLPLLSELISLNEEFAHYIENTYIFDDEGKYKDCIFVLHDFSFRNPEFTAYENELVDNEYFVDLIDIDNQVLYIFKFPEEYMHEYNCYKKGKYSHFGTDAKELILSFWTRVYKNNINAVDFLIKVKQILFKDIKLKEKLEKELSSDNGGGKVIIDDEAELGTIMESHHETFELSKTN